MPLIALDRAVLNEAGTANGPAGEAGPSAKKTIEMCSLPGLRAKPQVGAEES